MVVPDNFAVIANRFSIESLDLAQQGGAFEHCWEHPRAKIPPQALPSRTSMAIRESWQRSVQTEVLAFCQNRGFRERTKGTEFISRALIASSAFSSWPGPVKPISVPNFSRRARFLKVHP